MTECEPTEPEPWALRDARMDLAIAEALSLYELARTALRDGPRAADAALFELPDGPPGPLEIDAAFAMLVGMLEDSGDPLTAMAVLYVQAIRRRSPRWLRAAVLALGTCGPAVVGLADAARLAAGGRPADDPEPSPLGIGDVVIDARARDHGELMEVRELSADPETPLVWCTLPGGGEGRWVPEDKLLRMPRPRIAPMTRPES